MTVDLDAKARAYGGFFETVTQDNIKKKIRSLVTDDVRMKDPFNDVRGIDKLPLTLANLFEDADDIAFTMHEQAGDGLVYFLKWHFTCRPRSRFLGGSWQVDGISMIILTAEGLVKEHVGYWDAAEQFYEHLPAFGSLVRLVRRPLAPMD